MVIPMSKVARGKQAAEDAKSKGVKQTVSPNVLLAAGSILLLALAVRTFGIIDAGITWDETTYVGTALTYLTFLPKLSIFNAVTWSVNYEHPQVAKLIYALVLGIFHGPVYDLGAILIAKYASAFMGSLTCVLTYLLGREIFDDRTGILAGAMMALLPVMVAHGQIAGLDMPLALFFTATIFLFYRALKTGNRRYYAASAVAMGLTIGTRLNGLLIIPVIALIFAYFIYHDKTKLSPKDLLASAVKYGIVVVAILLLFWPWLWADFSTLSTDPLKPLTMTLSHWNYAPEEYFLGTYQSAPIYYLPVYFLVTTPLLVLGLGAVGAFFAAKWKDPYKLGLLLWLIIPFFSGFFYLLQDGVRYIIFIYPAVTLLAAAGLSSLSGLATKKWPKIGDQNKLFMVSGTILLVYLLISLAMVRPYYLDYYNSLSGGQQNVQEHRLLEFDWWGEGTKACIDYVETHATPESSVLMATQPNGPEQTYLFQGKNLVYISLRPANTDTIFVMNSRTGENKQLNYSAAYAADAWKSDYIIMNDHFKVYDNSQHDLSGYRAVFSSTVNGAPLCTVYEKIR
jgi:4-amino-4-deoxy-L-arabinose transferase-like glycosyltransferase